MNWRVVFEADGLPVYVVKVPGRGAGAGAQRAAVGDAIARFRAEVRRCMEAKGCRGFAVGVHVDGPDCDHEP